MVPSRKLYNGEFNYLCSLFFFPSLIVLRAFSSAWMCLPSSFLAMDVTSDFTTPVFGRHVTILKEVGCEDVNMIHLAQYSDQWSAQTNTEMNLMVFQKAWNFFSGWLTVSVSRSAPLHGDRNSETVHVHVSRCGHELWRQEISKHAETQEVYLCSVTQNGTPSVAGTSVP
jgi:hypothetical protein